MKRTMAWERLNDKTYAGSLNMEQFYHLLLEAGYSRESAQKAANERGYQRLCAGVTL